MKNLLKLDHMESELSRDGGSSLLKDDVIEFGKVWFYGVYL